MTEIDRQRVRRLFMELAELPEAERPAALARQCGGDGGLQAEVEALLRADQSAGAFLSIPASAEAGAEPHAIIGRYKLLQPIGEGGMGVVWMAEQREPVKRRVALKIIKLGMDTRQVIARFEAERQALALMDHPHIARVLDAGATETGRPYFVMEYIKGIPILEYCDREKVDTKARLELFTKVCHAIQHAHQKGIIHRDIKPSNVLVTLHDGVPVPKVIDFGIAKATNSELTARTLFTEHRQMIGTPAYMSPEQAEMSGLDIDTRSDIYSLGVLLYELLTGTTPFDMKVLLESGFAEMMRTIREVEPHKPSTRISTLGDTGTRTAELRRVDVKKLGASLRGDLDWIVMKCLEKDRARRYETASGLAADIQRHLHDEPVTASPPSATYQLRKFVKRHRGRVIATGIVAAVLVLGVIGTTAGMIHALAQRRRADEEASKARMAAASEAAATVRARENEQMAIAAARSAEAAQEEEARARRRAEAISDFVIAALRSGDARYAGGAQDTTILAAMGNAAAELDSGRFEHDPDTETALRNTIAVVLQNNGRPEEALALAERALETDRRIHPGDTMEVAFSLNHVARIHGDLGHAAEAERLTIESLEMYRRMIPGDHESVAALMNNLANLRAEQGRAAEAEPMMVEAVEMYRRLFPGDHADVAGALDNLAKIRDGLGRYSEADALYSEALEMRRRLYPGDHPDLAIGLNNLATSRMNLGRVEDAEDLLVQALEMSRRLFEGDHPRVAQALANLASLRLTRGRAAEAEPLVAEALAMNRRLFPGDHPFVAHSLYTLASVQLQLGRIGEAEPTCVEAFEMYRRIFPGDHEGVAMSLVNLGRARQALQRPAEARESFEEALAMLRRLVPGGSVELFNTLVRSADARLEAGDPEGAWQELEEAAEIGERILQAGDPRLADCREKLARCKAAVEGR